jgi:flagellar biosynthetic protein FlhB
MAEGQDKQHAPTERRLKHAAEQGNIRRSGDLPKAAAIVIGIVIALNAAAQIGAGVSALAAVWLSAAGRAAPAVAMNWAWALIGELAPLMFLIIGLSSASSLISGGWVFSGKILMPDFSKLLPSHGLGQVFSKSGMAETAKALLKFVVIAVVAVPAIIAHRLDFAAFAAAPVADAGAIFSLCIALLTNISAGIVLLAAADVALQWYLHRQGLRMSDTEMRDEMKEAVGNPQVRQRQRAIARRMAKARQMRRIPEASVVVTNPAHFAIAIRYRRGVDLAPLMLAKGVGLQAQEITSRARGLGIPIVQAPPLARAMHRHVEPGEQIPVALYKACAEILAYVWRLQQWRAAGGAKPKPPDGNKIPVAAELAVAEIADV